MIDRNNEELKQEVREYWDSRPCGTQFTQLEWGSREFFDDVDRFRFSSQPFMNRLVRFDACKGKRLLEIGCGLGTDLVQFARGGALVTGIDLTPRSIELAKRRFELAGLPADLRVADAEALPFADESFDVVYSFGVLHHTPDTGRAVDEVHRVLKPGGEMIIMLYAKWSLHVLLGVPLWALWHLGNLGNSVKPREKASAAAEEWIRVYDGEENPLGKAYSGGEVRRLFHRFRDLQIRRCDPIRRRFPRFVNWLNQEFLAGWLGFYMIVRGKK